jgi:hypothetical protein
MNRVAIGFMTKDRVDLSSQTVRSLLQRDKFTLFWFDGSSTSEGRALPVRTSLAQEPAHNIKMHMSVLGGPDAAVAYALTTMLKGTDYTHIGIVENDVMLHLDWFDSTMALFERGRSEGLEVGMATPRCYEDRILIQRDGYAVLHNGGWGVQILTREAARITLNSMRTGITTENRRLFCQLSGLDIGAWWAFRSAEHCLCPDWNNDRFLAAHGLASLALTPSSVEMIGQNPPLHEQGLKLAKEPVELLRNDQAFLTYAREQYRIRHGLYLTGQMPHMFDPSNGSFTIFPHQVAALGGIYDGDWRLKWSQGFGPFSWKAGAVPEPDNMHAPNVSLIVPLSGPVDFLVSGGEYGGSVELEDMHSGYTVRPQLPPEGPEGKILSLPCPAQVSYRTLKLTMLSPGCIFYGIRTREPQPWIPSIQFDWHSLPPV